MTLPVAPRNQPGPFGFCSFSSHPVELQPIPTDFSPAARCHVASQWYSYSPDGAAWLRMDPVEQRQPRFPLFPEPEPRQPGGSA